MWVACGWLAVGLWVALGWLWAALAVGQTFLSAGEADFPVRWIEGGGDWKVARTGRLENLPYATVFTLAHTWPDALQQPCVSGVGPARVRRWSGGGLTLIAQDADIK